MFIRMDLSRFEAHKRKGNKVPVMIELFPLYDKLSLFLSLDLFCLEYHDRQNHQNESRDNE